MKNFWSIITDNETGFPIPNCNIYVYSGATLATIYSDDGITLLNNPFQADEYGRYNFYVASGIYYLKFVKAGYDDWKSDPITIPDVIDEESDNTVKNKYVSNKIIKDLQDVKLHYKKELIEFDNIQCKLPVDLLRNIIKPTAMPYVDIRTYLPTGYVLDGSVDYTTQIQAAITASYKKVLFFPVGVFKLTNRLVITDSITIRGAGPLFLGHHLGSQVPPTIGTVFLVTFNTTIASDVFYVCGPTNDEHVIVTFEDIEFFCNYQPTPDVGWEPVVTPWAIRSYRPVNTWPGTTQVSVKNVLIRNFSHGIALQGDRNIIDGLFAQCFNITLFVDASYDVTRINNVHAWAFWSADTNVADYQIANARTIVLGRVDNPFISNIFVWSQRIGIHVVDSSVGVSPVGSLSLGQFINLGLDGVAYGVLIDTQYATDLSIANMYAAVSSSYSGSMGIWIANGSAKIKLLNAIIYGSNWQAINVNATSKVWLSNIEIRSYNQANAGAVAIYGPAGAIYYVSSSSVDTTEGNGEATVGGGATFYGTINGITYGSTYKKELIEFDNIQCQLPMEFIRHIMSNLKSSLP